LEENDIWSDKDVDYTSFTNVLAAVWPTLRYALVYMLYIYTYHVRTCLKKQNILYANINQILSNKLQGSMHCKIGVTCVYNEHVFYNVVIT